MKISSYIPRQSCSQKNAASPRLSMRGRLPELLSCLRIPWTGSCKIEGKLQTSQIDSEVSQIEQEACAHRGNCEERIRCSIVLFPSMPERESGIRFPSPRRLNCRQRKTG